MRRPEEDLDLGRACLLIAKDRYPQLCVELYLARLDQMAEEVRDRLADESAPLLVLEELLSVLWERRRLRGNRDAYYDARNSLLNDVLDRGLGIPLSLSIVLLEVGWRLGLPLEGVNFPRHFLVRFRGSAFDFLIDPFEREVRFADEADQILARVYGGALEMRDEFLAPASKRDMVLRLLNNLKTVYLGAKDHEDALAVVEMILLLRPGLRDEQKCRGVLLARLGRSSEAAEALEDYLDAAPAAEVRSVRNLLSRLAKEDAAERDVSP